jgi:hypothetical protein
MSKGFKAFAQSNPKKAEELGMMSSSQNMVTPKLRRGNSSTKYADVSDDEASDESDDEVSV